MDFPYYLTAGTTFHLDFGSERIHATASRTMTLNTVDDVLEFFDEHCKERGQVFLLRMFLKSGDAYKEIK
jgi:hypothetical protein